MAFKLEHNEHIILIARRHWFRPVVQMMSLLFTLLFPLLLVAILSAIPKSEISAQFGNLNILGIIIFLSWLFVVWNAIFVVWTNHFLDVVVLTNKNIIDIEQIGLWHREISTLDLEKVQDVSSMLEGIVASMLNYGTLEIQTAGNTNKFILKGIEKPDLIRQKINEQCNNL